MTMNTTLILLSTLILSYFIAQSSALKKQSDTFLGFKKDKFMSNTDKSLFNASELVFDATKFIYSQKGLKVKDKIMKLPGQPKVSFDQYGGYVIVNQKAGRALYYYFAEAQHSVQALPLVLWLNGGPGCSSLGYGAMQELGPFRVKSDGETLFLNEYAWNQAANVIFLESPAGVGFSYSNKTTDYISVGDCRTAMDSYIFLINWLQRFPEYQKRDFYIAGESYAGHYVPQLAHTILYQNKVNKFTINLKGIIIGNAVLDDYADFKGELQYSTSHALITEDLANQLLKDCDYHTLFPHRFDLPDKCNKTYNKYWDMIGNINIYSIYAPICLDDDTNHTDTTPKIASIINPDPCIEDYVYEYLNRADVQKALHANVTKISDYDWSHCSYVINNWTDSPYTILPIIKELMINRLRVWIFSGDVDGRVPVTSTLLSIKEMNLHIKSPWYSWYINKEVGGYTQDYEGGLTFATIRGAGHEVPTYQPIRALTLIQSFLAGKKLPSSSK